MVTEEGSLRGSNMLNIPTFDLKVEEGNALLVIELQGHDCPRGNPKLRLLSSDLWEGQTAQYGSSFSVRDSISHELKTHEGTWSVTCMTLQPFLKKGHVREISGGWFFGLSYGKSEK